MSEQDAPIEGKRMGLIGKLCEVMAEAGYVQKRGRNERFNYNYATEADVVELLRGKLAARNVFVFPSVTDTSRSIFGKTSSGADMLITDVMVKWTFVDGDTGETHECMMPGCGTDTGDKGTYKAITGSSKYLFLKAFMLPTGDDPEDEKVDREEGVANARNIATEKLRSSANGKEVVSVLKGDVAGYFTLSGPGLPIVMANLDNKEKGRLGMLQRGKDWALPTNRLVEFSEHATTHKVDIDTSAIEGHAPVIMPTGPPPPFNTPASCTDPIILEVIAPKPKEGKKQVYYVKWNGRDHSTFDRTLVDVLRENRGKPAKLLVVENGPYSNVNGIESINGLPYSRESGVD